MFVCGFGLVFFTIAIERQTLMCMQKNILFKIMILLKSFFLIKLYKHLKEKNERGEGILGWRSKMPLGEVRLGGNCQEALAVWVKATSY